MARLAHGDLRAAVIRTARALNTSGLTQGTSGNVGVRAGDGFLVTPTGMPYASLTPADIVFMDFDGAAQGRRLPSSEWRFHRDILARRPEANAVVHVHSMFATTLACLGKGIPAFHYMVAIAGGADIRCAPYATFGTEALSRHAVAALADRRACLLANHGMIAIGPDPDAALKLAVEVETLAAMYWRALQTGRPRILPAGEMRRVLAAFRGYGQQRPAGPGAPKPTRGARR